MSICHHAVVGVLLVHQGRIAVAHRQKPPPYLAPSAGHVDQDDGLTLSTFRTPEDPAWRTAAAREVTEETGIKVEEGQLTYLMTYRATDECAKIGANGNPGGHHTWQIFLAEVPTISRPTLRDEPGKMHGWEWRSISSLIEDVDLEPIWRVLLTEIVGRGIAQTWGLA